MTVTILPPKVADFVRDMMPSATHRRMLHIGMAMTKVSAMFQLLPDDEVPAAATGAFILLFEGLESGNAAEYGRCDVLAAALYREWHAGREVH